MTDRSHAGDRTLTVDNRGQSVWIGFALLLAVSVMALGIYQLQVVPAQNAQTEYKHYQTVRDDFRELRRTALLARHGGTLAVTVDMSPTYPTRALASNPPPPTPTLRTVSLGRMNVTTDGKPVDLSTLCGYGSDPVTTNGVVYEPDYHQYQAPTLVYEHSTVYRRTANGTLVQSTTALVENDTITITPLSGSFSRTAAHSLTLDLIAGPVGTKTVSGQINITIGTRLPVDVWRSMLSDEPTFEGVDVVGTNRIRIRLTDASYDVVCYGVGLQDPPPSGRRP